MLCCVSDFLRSLPAGLSTPLPGCGLFRWGESSRREYLSSVSRPSPTPSLTRLASWSLSVLSSPPLACVDCSECLPSHNSSAW